MGWHFHIGEVKEAVKECIKLHHYHKTKGMVAAAYVEKGNTIEDTVGAANTIAARLHT